MPAPPYSSGIGAPRKPELAHPREDLAMDLVLRVPLADVGLDLGLGEVAHGLLDEPVLVGQGEVDHTLNRIRAAVRPGRPGRSLGGVGASCRDVCCSGFSNCGAIAEATKVVLPRP